MADNVKTFTVGLIDGSERAFRFLDEKVEGLGEIDIKIIDDEYIPKLECLKRTVVYREIDQEYRHRKEELISKGKSEMINQILGHIKDDIQLFDSVIDYMHKKP